MADGRITFVTGAAGGIGQGVVARLVADGFHVAAMDINETAMNALMAKSSTGLLRISATRPMRQQRLWWSTRLSLSLVQFMRW